MIDMRDNRDIAELGNIRQWGGGLWNKAADYSDTARELIWQR